MKKLIALLLLTALMIHPVLSVGAEQHTGVSHDVQITHSRPLYSQVLVLILGEDTATGIIEWKIGVEDWLSDLFGEDDDHPKWAK